ncbi:BNR repeat-containing protein [Mucilaginibacter sp. UR6-1]|uniref:BNR repeat-containing protein n=1 Tax=Mucilaginibacter sp. UR6-1 TaxID=1435643 RepID=UPI001E3B18D3|nr:BNR repeat-containing protein [Mucilaginibacter sp. UR6-1]MCC8408316.1 BNR repeat-containing protein [Mucilaginibacter sp. UR6-1]
MTGITINIKTLLTSITVLFITSLGYAQSSVIATDGWANNSVNTVIFRKNSLVSFKDEQYAAYYDTAQYMVLAKRKLVATQWQTLRTPYTGDAADAHKCISIMVDGDGYLHVAWGLHNEPLNYCKSVKPGSLELSAKTIMTGDGEDKVSYPEFYRIPSGDLLFLYRNGKSGNGSLAINRYDLKLKKWIRVQDNLIDGEGKRNAYWQTTIDKKGIIHLSWVWRESPDVASNHDICYARSADGGLTWQRSNSKKYKLPITAATAEYACNIPRQSQLINQTSMFADDKSNPYIATYYCKKGDPVPQYHIIYLSKGRWAVADLDFRKTAFSLSGFGTKSIPVSRPQIIAWNSKGRLSAALIFRDAERGSKASMALSHNLAANVWQIEDITSGSVGSWEPTYDTELWKTHQKLHLFMQMNTQVDGEGKADVAAQPVSVIELNKFLQ